MKLYPFQKEGVQYALKHHYSINACEMGLGKTVQAIMAMAKVDLPSLIICPAYLKSNWQKEINTFAPHLKPTIFSYEQFVKNHTLYGLKKFIVFDEAHYLKNMTAKRTKTAHAFIKKNLPDYLMLLTGTPIKNRVTEFYSLLKLCSYNPRKTSGLPITKNFYHFANALAHKSEYRLLNGVKVTKYEGLKNKELLKKYLEGKHYRCLAKDELDLPPVVEKALEVEITLPQEDEEELEKGFFDGFSISSAKKDAAVAKAEHTAKYALELLGQDVKPLIVFTDHVDPCHIVAESLKEKRVVAQAITGATNPETRAKHVKSFQENTIDVLVCTIGSMSTGFTLTASNRIIFNDLSWCPADNSQALARIRRIGQGAACFVTYMVSRGIDEKITEVLSSKMKVLEGVLFEPGCET